MKSRLQAILIGLSSIAIAGSAAAHESHYRPGNGLSGSITISTGAPYPAGFYGTLHYGSPYPVVPAYYPQAIFYRDCGHWHARGHHRYERVTYVREPYYRNYTHHGKHHDKGRKHGRGHKGGNHHH